MAIESALASFLDLLALADEPGFAWGPAELRAAFQWGITLQQLLENAGAAAIVRQRLQEMHPQLPAGLQLMLPAIGQHPLQLTLERLLLRPAAAHPPGCWLEAVLAAYMAAVVLKSTGQQQEAAEQRLMATLARMQQAAAVQGILRGVAQQAAATTVAAQLQFGSRKSGRDNTNGILSLAEESRKLKEEALRYLTSPACLEAAAAAQLLAQRVQQVAGEQQEQAAHVLGGLLHTPATQMELELLCWVALLPGWEGTIQRLAGNSANSSSSSGAGSYGAGSSNNSDLCMLGAQQQAMQLLCAACRSQPDALLLQSPELLAEVCRQSFRFTCSYATILAQQQSAAADNTVTAAVVAQRRLAHAMKHPDHVTDYLRTKCCC